METNDQKLLGKEAQPQEFTPEQITQVASTIELHQGCPGSLIPVLEDIQETLGYLPKPILAQVAEGLGLPLSEVYGVVTFYHFFTLVPRGRHTIRCCLGTACYVRGAKANLDRMSGLLQVSPGQTTADRRFSLETVRCLGACGLAPVITVDKDTHRQARPSKLPEIIDQYR